MQGTVPREATAPREDDGEAAASGETEPDAKRQRLAVPADDAVEVLTAQAAAEPLALEQPVQMQVVAGGQQPAGPSREAVEQLVEIGFAEDLRFGH